MTAAFRLLAAVTLCAAAPLAAQDAPPEPDLPTCAYTQCALRLEPGLWGIALVQGRDGLVLDRESVFGMDLDGFVGSAPRARAHAERYSSARFRSMLAFGVAFAAISLYPNLDSTLETDLLVGIGALGLATYGGSQVRRAHREAARAIWEYNATLDRSP